MTNTAKNLVVWMVAVLAIALFSILSARISQSDDELSYSEFTAQLDRGHVASVILTGNAEGYVIAGEFKDGQTFETLAPLQIDNLVDVMLRKDVEVELREATSSSWLGHAISWTPIIAMNSLLVIMIALMFLVLMRSMPSSGSSAVDRTAQK